MKAIIVEDQDNLRQLLTILLEKEGFRVTGTDNGHSFLEKIEQENFDLIILDINLPDVNGLMLCDIVKKEKIKYENPIIIMLTSETGQDMVNKALKLGADDYIKKPFNIEELRLRINNITSRLSKVPDKVKKVYGVMIDEQQKKIYENGKEIEFTKLEYELCLFILKNDNRLITREEITNKIWQKEYFPEDRHVDIYLSKLKKKMVIIRKHIKSVSGYGYKFMLK